MISIHLLCSKAKHVSAYGSGQTGMLLSRCNPSNQQGRDNVSPTSTFPVAMPLPRKIKGFANQTILISVIIFSLAKFLRTNLPVYPPYTLRAAL